MSKKIDDRIIIPAMKAINNTFGYGRKGTHKKKCDICGLEFDEVNDLDVLVTSGPAKCPECKFILELQQVMINHWNTFKDAESNNPIEQKNFLPDGQYDFGYGITQTFKLDEYNQFYEYQNRTKRVKDLIERIDKARRYLYFEVEPQMKILESIFENKDRFWKDGGNLLYHVKNASLEFLVVKIKEMLKSESKYSLSKIRNIIESNKKVYYVDHKIISVKKFKISGDELRVDFPEFPIDLLFTAIDKVLEDYKGIVNAIADYRDNKFAHIGELKREEESSRELTYRKLKRIFNSLKIIFDGLYYSIAPDLFTNLSIDHNLWFGYLNQISQKYEELRQKYE